jgi:hypothetical protein
MGTIRSGVRQFVGGECLRWEQFRCRLPFPDRLIGETIGTQLRGPPPHRKPGAGGVNASLPHQSLRWQLTMNRRGAIPELKYVVALQDGRTKNVAFSLWERWQLQLS